MASDKHEQTVPLWGLFIALLALTGAEVGLYEFWHQTSHEVDGETFYFIPKFVLVLIILIFTLPKALIVLIYFMHLKSEKRLILILAIAPFLTTGIAVLVILSDTNSLQDQTPRRSQKDLQAQAFNKMAGLKDFGLKSNRLHVDPVPDTGVPGSGDDHERVESAFPDETAEQATHSSDTNGS